MNEESRRRFLKIKEEFLHGHDSDKFPPWYKRKVSNLLQCFSHPDFDRDFSILMWSNQESILDNYQELVKYFVSKYRLDGEIVETYVRFAITGKLELMQPDHQMWPSYLFHDRKKVAWPSEDPKKLYEDVQVGDEINQAYVNLHIGRSSTKKDIIWMINTLWDSEIEPRLYKTSTGKTARARNAYFRNSTIYYLHKQGMRNKDIVNKINEIFDEGLEYDDIKKAIKNFGNEHPDWLIKPYEKLKQLSDLEKNSRSLKLIFVEIPEPHFDLK